MKRKLPPIVEWLVVAGITTGLAILVFTIVEQGRNPKGPHGVMLPVEPPDETNRIIHATGLSIVAPVNWDSIHEYRSADDPFLCIAPRGAPGRRLKASLSIEKTARPSNDVLKSFAQVTFQDFPAYETCEVERVDTFDDPASSRYRCYIDRHGEWWFIDFSIADAARELPPQIRLYINTIQFPRTKAE